MQQQTFHGHSYWLRLQQESLRMSSSSKSSFSKRRHVPQTISWKRTNSLVNTRNNNKLALSNIDVAKNAHRQHRMKKLTYQRRIAFSISWTRQEHRGLVGNSVISDQVVPGSNSTAVSSVFLCQFFSKVRTAKNHQAKSFTRSAMASIHARHCEVTIGGYYKNYKPPRRLLLEFTNLWPK